MKFIGQGFQKLEHEQYEHTQTHRQTDATERITSRIYGGIVIIK